MMPRSKGYVDANYLRAAAELLQPIKQRSYTLMHIQSGQHVLDVGCGPGIDTVALARFTGPQGRVFGVDPDPEMLAAADERASSQNVKSFVFHRQGEAMTLPFESQTLDACRSERLFIHLSQPHSALEEMVRVTRPGGWIVVVDPDWGTASINTTEVEIERRLMRFRAEKLMHNGYAGRQLYGLFRQCKLTAISIEIFPIFVTEHALDRLIERLNEVEEKAVAEGILTIDDLDRWRKSLIEADAAGCFFASTNMVLTAGRKP